jgi:hypothetical protein
MGIIELLLVTLIVAGAAIYATWSLAPASVRLRCLEGFIRRLDAGLPLPRSLSERLRRAAVTRAARVPGCGQCGGNSRTPK